MKNNLLFCENCNELTENDVCPKCGKQMREPQNDDMCFVSEFGYFDYRIFTEALSNNDVPFIAMPIHEGFSRMNTPVGYKVYVRYDNYGEAVQTFEAIWGGSDETNDNADCNDPANVINSLVKVVVERPLGSVHPEHPNIKYGLNYGYVEGVTGGDGEEQDAYIIGVNLPLPRMSAFDGYVIAVIVRKNDVETKWVVAPIYGGVAPRTPQFTKEQIAAAVNFQEKFFDIEIIM